MVHWGRVTRNVFSNGASYIVTASIGFGLAPFVVHHLGNTGYGLWVLVLSLTGYFGLLDLGIRSSVGRFVARYLALNQHTTVNRTVSTAFAILGLAGALALLAAVVIVLFFFDALHLEPQYAATGKAALLVTSLNVASALPLGVFSSVLIALERYDILSGVTIVGEVVRAALVIACLKLGYGLVGLALVSLFITTAEYTASFVFVKWLYRPVKLSWRFVDFQMVRDLFGFSIFRFIWIMANQLIFYSDSVVIGIFLGAGSITYFAIAGTLINYGRNVVSLATDTLCPAAVRMDAIDDMPGLRQLLITGTRMSLMMILPLCLGFIFFGRQFISLWMGKEYASSAVFLTVLAIAQFSSMSQYVGVMILTGMSKHRLLAYVAIGEGIANLALSIILVRKIGLIGVAIGTVIPHIMSTALVIPLYTLYVLKLGAREYFTRAFLRPALCALPIALIGYGLYIAVPYASWLVFASEVVVICGVFGVLSLFFCFDARQRAAAIERVSGLFQREAAIHEA